jgi:hypothetical protein
MSFNRREFLRASTATALGIGLPGELFAQAGTAPAPSAGAWDAGLVRHLLPTVSDTRMLIKASFNTQLTDAPTLRVGDAAVRGRLGDTRGEHWHFYATDLRAGRRYPLSLAGGDGRALCQPWELSTFPGPDEGRKDVASCSTHAREATKRGTFCRLPYAIGCCGAD